MPDIRPQFDVAVVAVIGIPEVGTVPHEFGDRGQRDDDIVGNLAVFGNVFEDPAYGQFHVRIIVQPEGHAHRVAAFVQAAGQRFGNQYVLRTAQHFLCIAAYHRARQDVEQA